jgi:DNA-binding NarL/FixJ family response regulator
MPDVEILTLSGPRRPAPFQAGMSDGSESDRQEGAATRGLLVEDDFLVAGELQHCLAEADFEVIGPAATAADALHLALTFKPDLVVMDIRLTGARDGIEAAIDIYRQTAIRSIFVTAHSDPHTLRRGEAAEPLGWVQKPYEPKALVARIRAIVGKT